MDDPCIEQNQFILNIKCTLNFTSIKFYRTFRYYGIQQHVKYLFNIGCLTTQGTSIRIQIDDITLVIKRNYSRNKKKLGNGAEMSSAEMSSAETAWRRVVQRRISGAESAAPKQRCRNGPPP